MERKLRVLFKNDNFALILTAENQVEAIIKTACGNRFYVHRFEPMAENNVAEIVMVNSPDYFLHKCFIFRKIIDEPRKLVAEITCDDEVHAFLLGDIVVVMEAMVYYPQFLLDNRYNLSKSRVYSVLDGSELPHDLPVESNLVLFCDEAFINCRHNLLLHFTGCAYQEFAWKNGRLALLPKRNNDEAAIIPGSWQFCGGKRKAEFKEIFGF